MVDINKEFAKAFLANSRKSSKEYSMFRGVIETLDNEIKLKFNFIKEQILKLESELKLTIIKNNISVDNSYFEIDGKKVDIVYEISSYDDKKEILSYFKEEIIIEDYSSLGTFEIYIIENKEVSNSYVIKISFKIKL